MTTKNARDQALHRVQPAMIENLDHGHLQVSDKARHCMLKRSPANPVITPEMVKPSRPDFKADGTFNAGVAQFGDEVVLLVRVAESAVSDNDGQVRVPTLEQGADGWHLVLKAFDRSDPEYDFSDPREIKLIRDRRQTFLTSMSHLRLARSANGTDFTVDDHPFIAPANRYERFGCEDARITLIEGRYYINYTSVSDLGIATSLAVTDDFVTVQRSGVIFAPDNRDVCLFPRKIGGLYWALHRPAPLHFGSPVIWSATSPDLIHWGDHRIVAERGATGWESHKIGGGAQMLETDHGWLQIYHGVDEDQRYCLGALLLDIDDPTFVKRRLKTPLAEPTEPYEVHGFFGNVVFACGALIVGQELHVYYGAADQVMALGTIALADLWHAMEL
jgi:predicted GH43/DUF377 family glycosyl hydrolase